MEVERSTLINYNINNILEEVNSTASIHQSTRISKKRNNNLQFPSHRKVAVAEDKEAAVV